MTKNKRHNATVASPPMVNAKLAKPLAEVVQLQIFSKAIKTKLS